LWTESEHEIDEIRQGLIRIRAKGWIQDIPNIYNYVSPYTREWSERVDDYGELDDLVDDIVAHNTQQEVDLEEEEGQAIREPLLPVSHSEALHALHTLRRYTEEYQCSSGDFLRALRSFERELSSKHQGSLRQSTMESRVAKGRN
jgi:hypothetical protein